MNQEIYREKIKALHNEQGVSYSFIAKRIGKSATYISTWLKGSNMGEDAFQALCDYYNDIPFKRE